VNYVLGLAGHYAPGARGRSTRLTLSYRCTHEIPAFTEGLLGAEEWDDLGGGSDNLDGYQPVVFCGQRPQFCAAGSWRDDLAGILQQAQEAGDQAASTARHG
jgi:hypothetical protein